MGIIGKSGQKFLDNKKFGIFLILMVVLMLIFGLRVCIQVKHIT
jgi:hypothetical protein